MCIRSTPSRVLEQTRNARLPARVLSRALGGVRRSWATTPAPTRTCRQNPGPSRGYASSRRLTSTHFGCRLTRRPKPFHPRDVDVSVTESSARLVSPNYTPRIPNVPLLNPSKAHPSRRYQPAPKTRLSGQARTNLCSDTTFLNRADIIRTDSSLGPLGLPGKTVSRLFPGASPWRVAASFRAAARHVFSLALLDPSLAHPQRLEPLNEVDSIAWARGPELRHRSRAHKPRDAHTSGVLPVVALPIVNPPPTS